MIRVEVLGLALDVRQQPVILLRAVDERAGRVMPLWIGTQEASSILAALQGSPIERPLTHDLMATLLRSTDSHIERVTIPRIVDNTFFAEIELVTPNGVELLDARPSDAIALASRLDAPVWVAEDVYDEVSVRTAMRSESDAEHEEAEIAEFRDFVEHVDPDDFKTDSD